MEIFGIGPLELLLIMLLVLIIFGPKDLQKAGKTIGQTLNKLVKSDTWRTVTDASRRLRTLPNELMREANIEELRQQEKAITKELQDQVGEVAKGLSVPLAGSGSRTPGTPPEQVNRITPPSPAPDEATDSSKSVDHPSD